MVTFRVAEVERATEPAKTREAARVVAALGWHQPEAMRLGAAQLVDGPLVHPLALAVDLAFREHRPLVLTPDAVWLCLAQSLATHVELNAETLRARLVRHAGQLELDVRFDDFVLGSPDNDWPAAVAALTAKAREHLGGRADLFVADFSTTGPLERTASQIALLGAMRNYFRYSVSTLCGIPEITLAGTPEDWAAIRRRAKVFGEFELDWWLPALEPALATLEDTARGRIDVARWQAFYKQQHESGGDRSYGWFNALFAYVGSPPERSEFPTVESGGFDGHKLADFPSGRTRVPFTWKLLDRKLAMELVGGLWGVTADDHGALGVAAGWLVAAAREPSGFVLSNGIALQATQPMATLATLAHEATDEPRTLWLYHSAELRSLEGIEHVRGMVAVTVLDCPNLESVAPLAGLPRLERVELGRSRVASLAPLAGKATLLHLDVADCRQLTDLGATLATLPQLESLNIMGCAQLELADLAPIVGMDQLAQLITHHVTALPTHLRAMFWGRDKVAAVQRELAALLG